MSGVAQLPVRTNLSQYITQPGRPSVGIGETRWLVVNPQLQGLSLFRCVALSQDYNFVIILK